MIPSFHRDADGHWREITVAEHAAIMDTIEAAICPSLLLDFPGDEVPARCCLKAGHNRTRMHENREATRRWWLDDRGDVHATAKPGSAPLRAPEPCEACNGSGLYVVQDAGGDAHEEPCRWCARGWERMA